MAVLLLGLFQAALGARLQDLMGGFQEPALEMRRKWDPTLFRTLSFGQLPAAVDWLWIRCLTDPDSSAAPAGGHPTVFYHLDLISDLDPVFFETYTAGANLLAVVRRDGLGARDLLLKGDEFRKSSLPSYPDAIRSDYWADSWEIPLLLGYTYLFELNDMPSAAKAFEEAASVRGSPTYLQSLVRRLHEPGGEYEVGRRLLEFMIAGARDPRTRKSLVRRRDSLVVGKYLFEVNRKLRDFAERSPRSGRPAAVADLRRAWASMLKSGEASETDPWGGVLSVDDSGKVVSSTAHDRVLGLD